MFYLTKQNGSTLKLSGFRFNPNPEFAAWSPPLHSSLPLCVHYY